MKTVKSAILLSFLILTFLGCKENTSQNNVLAPQVIDSSALKSVSARPVHWGYSGENGPEKWGSLSPVYNLCAQGQGQSPINIIPSEKTTQANWSFAYKASKIAMKHNEHMHEIIDNGHTIQLTLDEGSTFTFNDKVFHLKQAHFHTPSEHTVNGQSYPMEMHWVHQSEEGKLAVVSVLFKEGKPNKNFEMIIAHLPSKKGDSVIVEDKQLQLDLHLPPDNYAYHYLGSLTTPPCSEGVQWLVLRQPVELSATQLQAIASRIGPNNRPVQNINKRVVEIGDLKGQGE
jgi:carbonic anhydrase